MSEGYNTMSYSRDVRPDFKVTIKVCGVECKFKVVYKSDDTENELRHGILESPVTLKVGGNEYTLRSSLIFSEDGKVYSGVLEGEHVVKIGGVDYCLRGEITFGLDGEVEKGFISKPVKVKIEGEDLVFLNEICFRRDGSIRQGVVNFDEEVSDE